MPLNNKKSPLSAKASAIQMLSRRDHGQYELKQKLIQKGFEIEEIEEAIEICLNHNWLDDLRYAKSQIRQHIYKGNGKQRIYHELKLKQIDEILIQQAFDDEPQDWFELACLSAFKKYKDTSIPTPKEYAKRARYLQYKGFSFEQIQFALNSDNL